MSSRFFTISMAAGLILACTSATLWGQSRKEGFTPSGQLRGVGERTSAATFRNYSYGVGNLQQSSPAGGTDLLRSSIGSSRTTFRSGVSGVSGGGINAL